jgi:hypothetical protein
MTAVVHCGDERCCDYRTNARQLREPSTGFVCSAKTQELLIQLIEPAIESAEFFTLDFSRRGKPTDCESVGAAWGA